MKSSNRFELILSHRFKFKHTSKPRRKAHARKCRKRLHKPKISCAYKEL
ncbi:hypothetical protein HMPREF3232_00761 [Fannyhessea vaginae]|nr:hypothetical protein HMPREF3232_00761 [Fannyhessea vaginae]